MDVARGPAQWRTEARFFRADDAIFPSPEDDGAPSRTNAAIVTSLSIRM